MLLARNEAYPLLTFVTVAPITTRIRRIRSYVLLDPIIDRLPEACAVQLDHIQAIRKDRLDHAIGHLSAARMDEVENAIRFALALSR